jgi:hypothetical protein
MEGISPFQSGRPLLSEITADKLNRILAEIKRNRPVVAAPLSARVTGDGTHISIKQAPGTSTPATTHPFQIISRQDPDSNPESPSYLVSIKPGALNGLLPTNLFDDSDLNSLPLSKDTLKHVVLTGQSDGQQFLNCALSLESAAPGAQEPVAFGLPQTVEFLLGVVYNSTAYQIISDNITVAGQQQYVADKVPPLDAGELPYTLYFVWG